MVVMPMLLIDWSGGRIHSHGLDNLGYVNWNGSIIGYRCSCLNRFDLVDRLAHEACPKAHVEAQASTQASNVVLNSILLDESLAVLRVVAGQETGGGQRANQAGHGIASTRKGCNVASSTEGAE